MPERLAAFALALVLAGCAWDRPQAELFDRHWTLAEIEGAPAPAPGRSTLVVARDGKVSGDGGCNRYAGQAEVTDQAVVFGPLMATKRACEPAPMRQETSLFEGLRRTVAWRVEGGALALLDAESRELLRFTPEKRP